MADCRISNPLADFLIKLAIDPELHAEFHKDKNAVVTRAEFGLSKEEQEVMMTDNRPAIRRSLDNIQIMP